MAAHLTQAVVAAKVGIHVVQLARIESGDSGTKRDTVIAIARAIGLRVNEALERAGFSSGDRPDDTELTIDMILPSGYEDLDEAARARFRLQLKKIGEALLARDD